MKIRCVASAFTLLVCAHQAVAESNPASHPFNYLDLPVQEAASRAGVKPNQANNVVFDTASHHVFLEAHGASIGYADVEFRGHPKCSPKQQLDSASALKELGIDASQMELAIDKPDNHTYYDHKRGIKVSVTCNYEGAPLTAGFSRKQYGVLMGSTGQ
jgi:hypothetical protein